jgi:sporulation protein YlmC with PRC-barrel domain
MTLQARHSRHQEPAMPRLPLAVLFAGISLAAAAQPAPAQKPDSPPAAAPDHASTDTSNPNLSVAAVKLDNGYRAKQVIGAAVSNAQNQEIGTVDDLILNTQNQVVMAVISVGGFLGVGGKLVAIPYGDLQRNNGKVTLANADKNTLAAMPSFTYGQ